MIRGWGKFCFCIVKNVKTREIGGKLSLVATPIGNMSDLTPNIMKCLFQADVIGCEDRRVAGQLYTLIKNKQLIPRMEDKFGSFGFSSLVQQEEDSKPSTHAEQEDRHRFYKYSHMTDKERRKFLGKMTLDQQKQFKIDYLKYRAQKIVNKEDQFYNKKEESNFDELYGIQVSDLKHIETQILNTRKKKGRGLLIPLNTYSETKMFDLVKSLLESKHVAIVSDAGMPCISDPGWRLVRNIRECMPEAPIQVVGGPSAVDMMLTLAKITASTKNQLSGRFEGFAAQEVSNITEEGIKIDKNLKLSKQRDFSIHFINSKKLKKNIHKLKSIYGGKHNIILANQLTKRYERKYHGCIQNLSEKIIKNDKQFDGKGQLSYLLYPQMTKKIQQEKIESEEMKEDKRVVLDARVFVKSLQGNKLKSKEKAQLLCSTFGMKMNEAKKLVYEQIKNTIQKE